MSAVNKELYDALIQANVSDYFVTKVAKSVSEENTTQLKDTSQTFILTKANSLPVSILGNL